MDLSKVTEITIPQGKVVKITNASSVVLWSAGRIPSIYQEVEWIKASNGVGAYLDLGFSFDSKATIELSHYIVENSGVYMFGVSENSGIKRCMLTLPYDTANKSGTFYGTGANSFIVINNVPYTLNSWHEWRFIVKKGFLHVENIITGWNNSSNLQAETVLSNNLYLFAQNYNGNARFGATRQISYFKYYDKNEKLICDLVPCYRKSDGEIGMYDLVRKIFLTNVGTGNFTKGNNV